MKVKFACTVCYITQHLQRGKGKHLVIKHTNISVAKRTNIRT